MRALCSRCKRIGMQSWLSIAIIETESLLCVKWGRGMFPNPAPPEVVAFWGLFTTVLVVFTLLRFTPLGSCLGRNRRKDAAADEQASKQD